MTRTPRAPRTPLTVERVVEEAFRHADEQGIETLSMRKLGRRLGVEAMSLYRHVKDKDQLLDLLVDRFMGHLPSVDTTLEWREAARERTRALRALLIKHRWALGLISSRRNPGEATLRAHDAMLGMLMLAGFSPAGAGQAYAILDSFACGFALQEIQLPDPASLRDMARQMTGGDTGGEFPSLRRFISESVLTTDYAFANDFEPGLEMILDGLQGRLDAAKPR